MPFLLLAVSTANALTCGVFVWCLGVLQMGLVTMITFKRSFSAIIVPVMMTIGGGIAAYTFINLAKSDGASALLEWTGTKNSSWSETAGSWVAHFGFWGLFAANLSPAPTALCVILGLNGNIPDEQIIGAFCLSRFLKISTVVVAQKLYFAEATLEDILRGNVTLDSQRAQEDAEEETSKKKD
mmetsp:Transcript_78195/g.121998  ORF Transcript_78195/g.121998 Transcript_78195/m.121998 type:complete len:183 (+) Transcript_78195:1-549(+)